MLSGFKNIDVKFKSDVRCKFLLILKGWECPKTIKIDFWGGDEIQALPNFCFHGKSRKCELGFRRLMESVGKLVNFYYCQVEFLNLRKLTLQIPL